MDRTHFIAVLAGVFLATEAAQAASHKPKPPRAGGGAEVNESTLRTSGSVTVTGEVWVDNWFKLHLNGKELIEDSVSITTERSFNAERFSFKTDLPATLAFEFRDFMENATGLEYIGTRKQQMGDGGAIAQFTVEGRTVAVTSAQTKCIVVQHAPVAASCASESAPTVGQGACAAQTASAPAGWTSASFDDSGWPAASVHSARAVSPKHGYDAISWDRSAQIIWGPNLEQDNIVLCRLTLSQ